MSSKQQVPVLYYTSSELKENKLSKKIFNKHYLVHIIETIIYPVILLTGSPVVFGYFEKIHGLIYAAVICACVGVILHLLKKNVDIQNDQISLSKELHHNIHEQRDIYALSMSSLLYTNPSKYTLEQACDSICVEISNVFKKIKNTDNIGVAIRLAKQENKGVYYITKGRFGLNQNRAATTEPIPFSTGLPAYLNRKNQTGCLIYNNIIEASKLGAFELLKNDTKYDKDILSLMALPLNISFTKSSKEMIGILYISSPKENFFSVYDVDHAKEMADIAAMTISQKAFELKIKQKNSSQKGQGQNNKGK